MFSFMSDCKQLIGSSNTELHCMEYVRVYKNGIILAFAHNVVKTSSQKYM